MASEVINWVFTDITNISRDLFQSGFAMQQIDQYVFNTYTLAFKWLCYTVRVS